MNLQHVGSSVMVSRPGDFSRPIVLFVPGGLDYKLAAGEAGGSFRAGTKGLRGRGADMKLVTGEKDGERRR
nr:hypothetical protein [Candidatus Sigynarchaeota archaeon]